MYISCFPEKSEFEALAKKYNVVPLCCEMLADTQTPVSLLQYFSKTEDDIFLLESVQGGQSFGRYSFIGLGTKARVKVFADHIEYQSGCNIKRQKHDGDAFGALRELMRGFEMAEVDGLPRFAGGLIGTMDYEMVSFIENIPNKQDKDKSLARFVIPEEMIVFDNFRHTVICIQLTYKEDDGEIYYEGVEKKLAELVKKVQGAFSVEEMPKQIESFEFESDNEPEEYKRKVDEVKEHIFAGDIIQAVISQQFTCKAPDDEVCLYRALRYINPSPYLYFVRIDGQTVVGASPETMVRLEDNTACLRPIAGTRKRGQTQQQDRELADDLLKDEKERAEHLMLVDLGRNDLGRIAVTGTVQVTDLMFVERYSHVMHLVSNIVCQIDKEKDAFDLIKATFPAGTLSGAPKVRAMEIIAEKENSPRGAYGGAVGYIGFNGNMDMAITIRTAVIEDGILKIRAGAGIVADSVPESEFVETVNKAEAVKKALEFAYGNRSNVPDKISEK
ncbi:MAG: anthranilate synthase component I family protein [Phycisphaerae bacterium]|nr:anthranilate synthase component I family protein [Phycisphaerae bacterium]